MQTQNGLTVAKKLALLPGTALLGILLISAVMLHDIGSVYESAGYAAANTVPSLLVLDQAESHLASLREATWKRVSVHDTAVASALEDQLAAAAKEIKGLIEDSVRKVSEGTKLVDESGRALGEIVTGIKKVTDVVAEISASSQEQASGIEQVNKAVTAMDATTQENAALVEEASAATQALTEQASHLGQLIERYRIGNAGSMPSATPAPARNAVTTASAAERRAISRPWNGKSGGTPRATGARA